MTKADSKDLIKSMLKYKMIALFFAVIIFSAGCNNSDKKTASEENNTYKGKNVALNPPEVIFNPENEKYKDENRKWQGIPSIEITEDGTLWVVFYSGGTRESNENYVLAVRSDDKGKSWSDIQMLIEHPDSVRTFDPCIWKDPQSNIWISWSQSYGLFDGRSGVWAIKTTNPDDKSPQWSDPVRLANGIMMNKPTFLSSGEWLLPCAVWKEEKPVVDLDTSFENEKFSNVYSSKDNGKSFKLKGGADIPDRHYDEHKVIEKKDGTLWMLVRTHYGIGQSYSYDKGKTWTPGEPTKLGGPSARFHISRLASGNLLLVNHYKFTGRNNLTAMISKDDGNTWEGYLTIDERNAVSYPNATQDADGTIYIVYDRERGGDGAKEILMATLTEKDILAGKCISEKGKLKTIVNKAGKKDINQN